MKGVMVMKLVILTFGLVGLMTVATAYADPIPAVPQIVLPASGGGFQQQLPTACRWVKDTSGIPDPNRPQLVPSCLPRP
jgi:hypothetical protein